MENEDLKGVYCILNKVNNKRYIGSTVVSFKDRGTSTEKIHLIL